MTYDYIIVGAGVAGTILADVLGKEYSVLLIDRDSGKYGSRVAAGIYNPVTGRRMVKAWMAETFSSVAMDFYRSKEAEYGETFLYEMNVKRLFHNEEQRKEWLNKVDFYQIDELIAGEIDPEPDDSTLHRNYGGVETNGSWRLDASAFLESSRKALKNSGQLVERDISYDEIKLEKEDLVRVGEYSGENLVFCEGWQMVNNPWFNYLPIVPNKGELLLIHAPDLRETELLQKGMFVLPVGNDHYKVGASYDRDNQSYQVTDKAKTWLLERLERVIKTSYKIIDQKAGIRPTVKDRRPLIGQHSNHSSLYLFNGFGSKGVSQTPWCAGHFLNFLVSGTPLIADLNISRFSKDQ